MIRDALGLSGGLVGIMFVAGVITAGAVGWPGAAAAQPSSGRINRDKVEIMTAEDRALIARKCGESGEGRKRSLNMRDGVLICSNGREVQDPEVRAMASRVSERARNYARNVMERPGVRAAMNGDIQRRVEEATRRARNQRRPNIDRALARARVHVHRVDHEEIRRNVERSLRRAHPHPDHHVGMTREEHIRLRADLDRMRSDLEQLREELRRDRGEPADGRR